jgi:hypothetical protein
LNLDYDIFSFQAHANSSHQQISSNSLVLTPSHTLQPPTQQSTNTLSFILSPMSVSSPVSSLIANMPSTTSSSTSRPVIISQESILSDASSTNNNNLNEQMGAPHFNELVSSNIDDNLNNVLNINASSNRNETTSPATATIKLVDI